HDAARRHARRAPSRASLSLAPRDGRRAGRHRHVRLLPSGCRRMRFPHRSIAFLAFALAACAAPKPTAADGIPAAWAATHHAVTATGDSAMIVSASPIATRVGVNVLRAGGNAVDAAVAVALALSVAYPTAGNLGGGGFIVA